MCRNNEQWARSKGETWSRGTNSRKHDSYLSIVLQSTVFLSLMVIF